MTRADIFAGSPMDVKKMIVSQMIDRVSVSENYSIELNFRISVQQLGLELETAAFLPKKARTRRETSL